MKNRYLSLLLLFIIPFAISCEKDSPEENEPEPPVAEDIIEIPDEHFKNALVNTNSIDTNGDGVGDSDIDLNDDGEIQRSEADLIEGLILHFDYNELGRYVDLTGIENFVNLKFMKMTGDKIFTENNTDGLITYDLSKLKKLQFLELSGLGTNSFSALDLHGLDNLTELKLAYNSPDYTADVEDWGNPVHFMDVNLEGVARLTTLNIHNSFLIMDFCQVPGLKNLNMSYLEGGEPEIFDFHCLTELEWLDISENVIKSLILKNSSAVNTLLVYDIGTARDRNYPFVEYICIDDIPEEFEQIIPIRNENTVVVTDCTF